MKKVIILILCLSAGLVQAQKKKKQDAEAILDMCGCYEVTFNFAETFAPDQDYEFHDNYKAKGLEYVHPVEQGKDKIVLQHLLIVGDSTIIKHWRQDWIYENTDFYYYDADNRWTYASKTADEVAGQWTQKVYQVDDGPRYEGSASWVHIDGRHFWENTTDAPLPRREFSKRDDYNVMVRTNRHELTEEGWIHEQDNAKVIREGGEDELLAQEKGLNTYRRVDDAQCEVARDWWVDHSLFWNDVREVWAALFETKNDLSFKKKVEGKVLFMKIFELEKELLSQPAYDSQVAKEKIAGVIDLYLEQPFQWVKR